MFAVIKKLLPRSSLIMTGWAQARKASTKPSKKKTGVFAAPQGSKTGFKFEVLRSEIQQKRYLHASISLKTNGTNAPSTTDSPETPSFRTKNVENWTYDDVVQWAKELGFASGDLTTIKSQRVNGRTLLAIPTLERLEKYGLSPGATDALRFATFCCSTEIIL